MKRLSKRDTKRIVRKAEWAAMPDSLRRIHGLRQPPFPGRKERALIERFATLLASVHGGAMAAAIREVTGDEVEDFAYDLDTTYLGGGA